ncbi:MAG: helix-turn-helix domain-containing protein [Thermoanaerobaculia bacterium]|nr:helix-turn-helix domain-containing protein [Thermoanaerobaculia bacterium]
MDHLSEELPIETLADRAHVSPRHLSRLFRRETGESPAVWVEKARLDLARRLLTDGDAPVKKIASDCGFGNPERMRRAFHRHLRLAPSDYRELHRKEG